MTGSRPKAGGSAGFGYEARFSMEAIIFVGIPGSGKSTFYKERFANTHIRINRDMLKTARRQRILVQACCEGKISFVLDNTNVTRTERVEVLALAKAAGFRVQGYFFESKMAPCLERNAARPLEQRIPDSGVRGRRNALELPELSEGLDALWFVRIVESEFEISAWREEHS